VTKNDSPFSGSDLNLKSVFQDGGAELSTSIVCRLQGNPSSNTLVCAMRCTCWRGVLYESHVVRSDVTTLTPPSQSMQDRFRSRQDISPFIHLLCPRSYSPSLEYSTIFNRITTLRRKKDEKGRTMMTRFELSFS
jgi:hypothetical protein